MRPIRYSQNGPTIGRVLNGVVVGPIPPGSFTHEVVSVPGVHEGAFVIPQLSATPDEYLIVFQHSVVDAVHLFVLNLAGAGTNIPVQFLVFQ